MKDNFDRVDPSSCEIFQSRIWQSMERGFDTSSLQKRKAKNDKKAA